MGECAGAGTGRMLGTTTSSAMAATVVGGRKRWEEFNADVDAARNGFPDVGG